MKLVLASNNAGKLAELQSLFAPLGLLLVRQGDLGIPEAEEPHLTFIENALAKARHAARHAGSAAIADDSGLCVDALGGAPGIPHHSLHAVRQTTGCFSPSCLRFPKRRSAAHVLSARSSPCARPTTPSRWWRWGGGLV